MALIEPVSYMSYIQSNREEVFDPETSAQSASLVKDVIRLNFPEITAVLPLEDAGDGMKDLESQIALLYSVKANKLDGARAPAAVRNFIREHGFRYGAAVFATGFTRDSKEYKKQVAKGALLGIITAVVSLGAVSYYAMPLKYSSSLYMIVVDAQEDKIVFYERIQPEEVDPLNAKWLRRRIERFRKHFK